MSEGLGITARGKVCLDWLVLKNDVISEVECFLDEWVRKGFLSCQETPQKRDCWPRRVTAINDGYSEAVVIASKLHGEGDAIFSGGAIAPFSDPSSDAHQPLWMIVRVRCEIDGMSVSILVDEPCK